MPKTSKMRSFATIVKEFYSLAFVAKFSIVDVCRILSIPLIPLFGIIALLVLLTQLRVKSRLSGCSIIFQGSSTNFTSNIKQN